MLSLQFDSNHLKSFAANNVQFLAFKNEESQCKEYFSWLKKTLINLKDIIKCSIEFSGSLENALNDKRLLPQGSFTYLTPRQEIESTLTGVKANLARVNKNSACWKYLTAEEKALVAEGERVVEEIERKLKGAKGFNFQLPDIRPIDLRGLVTVGGETMKGIYFFLRAVFSTP